MGAVNYCTSDYITLGIKPYDVDDFNQDDEFMEWIEERVNEYGGAIEQAIYDYVSSCYEDDYSNIATELNKHTFYFYHVAIKPGYYEGFSLDIESNFPVAFDSWQDKRDAQKEITELKQFLIDCAGLGLVQCAPGWCTKYSDYNGTLEAIRKAVEEMREDVKTAPTWSQYNKAC